MNVLLTTIEVKWWDPSVYGDQWTIDRVDGEVVIFCGEGIASDVAAGGHCLDDVLALADEQVEKEDSRVHVTEWSVTVSDGRATCAPIRWEELSWAK